MSISVKERNALIEQNMGLIVSIARKLSKDFNFQQDLINEGVIGAIKGVESFDKERQCKLSSYIGTCALNEMRRHITNNSDLLNIAKKSNVFSAIKLKIMKEDTFNWTHKDVEQFSELNKFKFKDVLNVHSATLFGQIHENIPTNAESITDVIEKEDILNKIAEFTRSLESKESDAFYFVYAGIGQAEPISAKHGCHRNKLYKYASKVKASLDNYLQLQRG
jgi:RNA polymerase sigma factor (sigma-70 family)